MRLLNLSYTQFFECLVLSFFQITKIVFNLFFLLSVISCLGSTDTLFWGQLNQYFSLFLWHLSSSMTFIAFAFSFEVWFSSFMIFPPQEMTQIFKRLNLSIYQCHSFVFSASFFSPHSITSSLIWDGNCGIFK